jgi:hypothetical protein
MVIYLSPSLSRVLSLLCPAGGDDEAISPVEHAHRRSLLDFAPQIVRSGAAPYVVSIPALFYPLSRHTRWISPPSDVVDGAVLRPPTTMEIILGSFSEACWSMVYVLRVGFGAPAIFHQIPCKCSC